MKNETKEIRYIDLFGGVGGFRLGIERATSEKNWVFKQRQEELDNPRHERDSTNINDGESIRRQEESKITSINKKSVDTRTKCVFYCDSDKYAVQTYNKNFGENYEATDIRTIKTSDIPDFDMLCGGFPCQAFSIAGKRRGFEDTRGTLFFEIARIIKAKRPKIVFLENVKGLLNHNKGQTFSIIIQTLSELGYDVQWMVLNSKFFGVPQNRERVFIIGSLRGTSRPEILPFRETSKFIDERNSENQIASSLQHPGHSGGNYRGMNMISKTIRKGGRGSLDKKHNWDIIRVDRQEGRDREYARVYSPEGIAPTLHLKTGGWQEPKIAQALQTDSQLRQGSSWGTSNPQSSRNIRKLTPIECERLQGFPDNWTEGVSDTQRYKQMGNAVTVDVVQAIAERLIPCYIEPS